MDNRKISIVIINYNEYLKLIESFAKVMFDDRISEILILDNKSDEEIYYQIEQWFEYDATKKIRLAQTVEHIGEEDSRHNAIVLADGEWVLFIKNNPVIGSKTIDLIFETDWHEEMIIDMDGNKLFINRKNYLRTFKPESE